MRPSQPFLALWVLFLSAGLILAGCGPSVEAQSTMTSNAITASAFSWTYTPTLTPTSTSTPTSTPTSSSTPTSTSTPTPTSTPTITSTPTFSPSPTFNFPKVTVNKTAAACMWGPSVAYLYGWDLRAGDTGTVYGRAPVGTWLYVYMDRVGKWCWIARSVVDLVGDPNTVIVESIQAHLPWANNLYAAPENITSERQGDQVTVSWSAVWMTQDDDNGYFLDVWVCQGGNLIWMPTHMENQYSTTVTFTDETGCSENSGGQIYTVEKHGYTNPKDIPWPQNR